MRFCGCAIRCAVSDLPVKLSFPGVMPQPLGTAPMILAEHHGGAEPGFPGGAAPLGCQAPRHIRRHSRALILI